MQPVKTESYITIKELVNSKQLSLIYDGDCPFCSAYVKYTRLKNQVGEINLINARETEPAVLQELEDLQFDLNQGMLMIYAGKYYFGADCMHMLALLSGKSDFFNKCWSIVFKNHTLAKLLYPILRTGRNATLKLLGKKKI